ncbi:MAG: diacylglycerol kinase family protein [Clostridia bacterium]|nr:diacylglycerol kinase family protein [Clostridia bacterium]
MKYFLYNPLCGSGESEKMAKDYSAKLTEEVKMLDMTEILSYEDLIRGLDKTDEICVFGGDGTLNKLVNAIADIEIEHPLYYFPSGKGNDFANDICKEKPNEPILINQYIKNLPTVTVNGKRYRFINGVGFGIDGYCCEVGDRLKAEGKKPNYTSIAIKGLLFGFSSRNAEVVVDGERMEFKKVWIAPTMFGRYYGGGMMPTPCQDRCAEESSVSLMVFHGSGKLRTLMIFPSIFKGEHVKKKKHVSVFSGKNITVRFDRPTPLQIDGETVLGVTEYTVEI